MLEWIIPPATGALVGWGTNWLALKMLFHPREPWRVGPWSWQGVIPRRKADLAVRLGEMVENELFNHHDLRAALTRPELLDGLREPIRQRCAAFAQDRLPTLHPMVGMFLTQALKDRVAELLATELEGMLPDLAAAAADGLETQLSFRDLVRSKVESFSVERVEALLLGVLKREFGFIEWSGAVLGLLVGLVQLVLLRWLA